MEIDYDQAPNGWGEIWRRYVEHGLSPGSFGASLLCNDLRGAVLRADATNIQLIPQHIQWMWSNLPYEAWGSREAYERWTANGGTRCEAANNNGQ